MTDIAPSSKQERVEFLIRRSETPEHQEFMRLLNAYLEVLRLSSHIKTHDTAEPLVESREKLFEWARPASKTSALRGATAKPPEMLTEEQLIGLIYQGTLSPYWSFNYLYEGMRELRRLREVVSNSMVESSPVETGDHHGS